MAINLGARPGSAGHRVAGAALRLACRILRRCRRHGSGTGRTTGARDRGWEAPVSIPVGGSEGVRRRDWVILWTGRAIVAVLGVLMWTGAGLNVSPVTLQGGAIYVIVTLVAGYFAYLLLFAGLTAAEKRRVALLLVLVLAASVFWAGYEQAGSALNLFAERYTDRLVGSFTIPAGWFQSVPAAFVIIFAPVLAWLWVALDRRGVDVPLIGKFAFAPAGHGPGIPGDGRRRGRPWARTGSSGPMWLVLTYLLHTLGELTLSPVGMSATTQAGAEAVHRPGHGHLVHQPRHRQPAGQSTGRIARWG